MSLPKELTSLPTWIRWDYKPTENGKKTKIPVCVDGRLASSTDPNTWSNYDRVSSFEKIGFVFRKENGIIGIDLDHCFSEERPLQLAECILEDSNSYTELSPSGEGLHVLGYGKKPTWLQSRYDLGGVGIEVYDSCRYFTVTGRIFRSYSVLGQINLERVFDFLKPTKVETTRKKTLRHGELRLSVHDVISGFEEEENTTHPFHDSTTGANFRIDKGGETWRCWRHAVTGNALHLLGQREGIIECGERPSKDQWKLIINAAKKHGLAKNTRADFVKSFLN